MVAQITGVFSADGAFSSPLPPGAVLIGGSVVPVTDVGVDVSLGTTLGASDVLPTIAISGIPDIGQPLQGINFLESMFPPWQQIFVHSDSWNDAAVYVTIWYLTNAANGPTGQITGSFSSDGVLAYSIPAGAVIIGGSLVPGDSTGVRVSLGTSAGASDVLPATNVPGTPSPGLSLQGINFLESMFPSLQPIFVHSNSWGGGVVAVTVWYLFPQSDVALPVRVPTVDARGSAYRGFSYAYVGQPPTNSFPPTLIRANMRQGTEDYRGVSYWQILQDAGAYIDEITGIAVARMDGQMLGQDDLLVVPFGNSPWATVDARYPGGPSVVNWWQIVGDVAVAQNVSYLLTIAFTTTTGEELVFDAIQIVVGELG